MDIVKYTISVVPSLLPTPSIVGLRGFNRTGTTGRSTVTSAKTALASGPRRWRKAPKAQVRLEQSRFNGAEEQGAKARCFHPPLLQPRPVILDVVVAARHPLPIHSDSPSEAHPSFRAGGTCAVPRSPEAAASLCAGFDRLRPHPKWIHATALATLSGVARMRKPRCTMLDSSRPSLLLSIASKALLLPRCLLLHRADHDRKPTSKTTSSYRASWTFPGRLQLYSRQSRRSPWAGFQASYHSPLRTYHARCQILSYRKSRKPKTSTHGHG